MRIVNGAALVHSLDPKKTRTTIKMFQDYAQHVFLPYIMQLLRDVIQVDLVWDVYRKDSFKAQARQSSATAGSQIKIANSTSIPMNWANFLRVDSNKDGLFHLLATAVQEHQFPIGKTVICTYGENAISSPILDPSELHYTHEEADTMPWHAIERGLSKVIIHVTDTDVVILAVAVSSYYSG